MDAGLSVTVASTEALQPYSSTEHNQVISERGLLDFVVCATAGFSVNTPPTHTHTVIHT